MPFYLYSEKTKQYLGEAEIKAHNSTTHKPPQTQAGFIAIYEPNNDAWQIYEDIRNKKVWSKQDKQAFMFETLPADFNSYTTKEPKDYEVWSDSFNGWVKEPNIFLCIKAKEKLSQTLDKKLNIKNELIDILLLGDDPTQKQKELKEINAKIDKICTGLDTIEAKITEPNYKSYKLAFSELLKCHFKGF